MSDTVSLLAKHVAEMLTILGWDVNQEDFRETPQRVARMLLEFSQPADLAAVLKDGFDDAANGGIIVQQHIPFRCLCPHHLLPVVGEAHIGYVPNKRMVGLSKLARLVDAAGTLKPATQEYLTNLIADTLHTTMETAGTIVVTEAAHSCMTARGVFTPQTRTRVSAIRGVFVYSVHARQEFFSLLLSSR